jgi:hypothetical protein
LITVRSEPCRPGPDEQQLLDNAEKVTEVSGFDRHYIINEIVVMFLSLPRQNGAELKTVFRLKARKQRMSFVRISSCLKDDDETPPT